MAVIIEKLSSSPLPVFQCGALKFMLLPVLVPDEDSLPDTPYRFPYRVWKDDGLIPTVEEVESLCPVVDFLLQYTEGEA
jgi:hypothetical protein